MFNVGFEVGDYLRAVVEFLDQFSLVCLSYVDAPPSEKIIFPAVIVVLRLLLNKRFLRGIFEFLTYVVIDKWHYYSQTMLPSLEDSPINWSKCCLVVYSQTWHNA